MSSLCLQFLPVHGLSRKLDNMQPGATAQCAAAGGSAAAAGAQPQQLQPNTSNAHSLDALLQVSTLPVQPSLIRGAQHFHWGHHLQPRQVAGLRVGQGRL